MQIYTSTFISNCFGSLLLSLFLFYFFLLFSRQYHNIFNILRCIALLVYSSHTHVNLDGVYGFYCFFKFKEAIREVIRRFKIAENKWRKKREKRNKHEKHLNDFVFCKWTTPILMASNRIHTKCAYILCVSVCVCSGWSVFACSVSNEIDTHTHIQTRCSLHFYSKLKIRNRKNLAFVSICFEMNEGTITNAQIKQ